MSVVSAFKSSYSCLVGPSIIGLLFILPPSYGQDTEKDGKMDRPILMPGEWAVRVADVGHENRGPVIDVRSNGAIRVLRPDGRAEIREQYSGTIAPADVKEVYDSVLALFRAFDLRNRARSDIGRDDDAAFAISVETYECSMALWFQGGEQVRDLTLTERLARVFAVVDRNVPRGQGFGPPRTIPSTR